MSGPEEQQQWWISSFCCAERDESSQKKKKPFESPANTVFLSAFVFPFIPLAGQHCVVVVLSAVLREVRNKQKMLMISLRA